MRINNKQYNNFKGGLKKVFNNYDISRNDKIEIDGVCYKVTDFWNLNKKSINKTLKVNNKYISWLYEVLEVQTDKIIYIGRTFAGLGQKHHIINSKAVEKLNLESNNMYSAYFESKK